ncbi:hypothetical protein BDA96_03G172600 [Sorghum bicolor]|uniref:AP2/ERF domain-containing protein n=1 Tax=Sorghum bicolor TaxID=4558 RepID=A0A921UQ86_SORBI|nr:hypothetical protein BDA96_03G172600 [Sorghum bicolor]
MAASGTLTSTVALAEARQQQRSGCPATGSTTSIRRDRQKDLGWAGVLWGGWAMEIRVPHTRLRLWIGKFRHSLEAALAYDAAMFCFYGEHLPRPRRFNFLGMWHPTIPKHLRIHLTIPTIRAIAADHGRSCAAFLAPLLCRAAPRGLSTQPLMAMVPGSGTDGPGTTAGADEAAFADGHHGDNENMFLSCLCDE